MCTIRVNLTYRSILQSCPFSFLFPFIFRHQSKVVPSLMTLISMMKHTTMVVSPCCLRKEADDPSVASPFVCVGALSVCHLFEETDPCLPPEGTMTTWAPVGVLRHRWAEVDGGAAELVTCLFRYHHRQEEGEEAHAYMYGQLLRYSRTFL